MNVVGKIDKRKGCVYLFLCLMFAAKGLGLDLSNPYYKMAAGIGLILVAVSVLQYRYTVLETQLVFLLIGLAFVNVIVTGTSPVLLFVLVLIAIKDMDVDKILAVIEKVWIIAMLILILAAVIGFVPNPYIVQFRSSSGHQEIRYGMGYISANVFHGTFFTAVALICYIQKRMKWYGYLLLFLLNLGVYRLTYSTTGAAMCMLAIIGLGVAAYMERYCIHNELLLKITGVFCAIPPLISLLSAYTYRTHYQVWAILNSATTGRVNWSSIYVHNYSLTLLGQKFSKDLPGYLDNWYCTVLLQNGVLIFGLLMVGYFVVVIQSYRQRKFGKLVLCFLFLLYGFAEQFMQNCFINITLLFIAEAFWNSLKKGETKYGIQICKNN